MDKYNFLTMISEKTHGKHPTALFRCECGTIKRMRYDSVKAGTIKSCGCKRKYFAQINKHYKHAGHGTRLYNIYNKMKARCYDPNYSEAKYYGERGITVCEEWRNSFEIFRDWAMAHGYNDDLSIDRIDTNKGYSPDNCRWATPIEQSRNKRSNIRITYNGETKCLKEWCDALNLPYGTIGARIRRGWEPERALTEPLGKTWKKVNTDYFCFG